MDFDDDDRYDADGHFYEHDGHRYYVDGRPLLFELDPEDDEYFRRNPEEFIAFLQHTRHNRTEYLSCGGPQFNNPHFHVDGDMYINSNPIDNVDAMEDSLKKTRASIETLAHGVIIAAGGTYIYKAIKSSEGSIAETSKKATSKEKPDAKSSEALAKVESIDKSRKPNIVMLTPVRE